MQEGNDDVIPYCIATGEVKKLVNFFTSRGQLKEAVLVAQVQGTVFFLPIQSCFKTMNLCVECHDKWLYIINENVLCFIRVLVRVISMALRSHQ